MQHRVLRTMLWIFSFHLHLTLCVVFKNCFPMSRPNLPSFLHSFYASSAFCYLPLQRNRHVKQRLLFQNCILHDISYLSLYVCVCASVSVFFLELWRLFDSAINLFFEAYRELLIVLLISWVNWTLMFLACTTFLFSSSSLISYPIPL